MRGSAILFRYYENSETMLDKAVMLYHKVLIALLAFTQYLHYHPKEFCSNKILIRFTFLLLLSPEWMGVEINGGVENFLKPLRMGGLE